MDVDKFIGKFFTGAIPWLPTIQVHCNRIDYWHQVLRIKIGVLTSKNAIKKLSIKLGEYSGYYLAVLACLDKLKIAWKEYRATKKVAWSLHENFLEDKIAKKAHNAAVRPTISESVSPLLIKSEFNPPVPQQARVVII